jgi:hypothetical protein
MSVSTLAQDASWRDYFGDWNSFVEPQMSPLEESLCHAPRFATIPPLELQVVPAAGKITYNFHLVPGSVIWGLWPGVGNAFVMQLTDVNLGHKLCQEPEDGFFGLTTVGSTKGRFPSFTLLPTPWPVVGDGLFTLELWAPAQSQLWIILGVAEVTECLVR